VVEEYGGPLTRKFSTKWAYMHVSDYRNVDGTVGGNVEDLDRICEK